MSSERFPVTITVQPWFRDHFFAGKIILPAVETMLLLADWVAKAFPAADIRVMEAIRFAKFLELPPDATRVEALIESAPSDDDRRVDAKLLSRIPCGKMSRIKEHGVISFPLPAAVPFSPSVSQVDPAPPQGSLTEITAEHLYRELVPFGSQYQTLEESLYLTEDSAWGKVRAKDFPPLPIQDRLGSPFPLDGAMHAACVLGRQSVDFIPFPVAIDRRVILLPTQPGALYLTKVTSVAQTQDELVFDLCIFDRDGVVFEAVSGLRMLDVGGGRVR